MSGKSRDKEFVFCHVTSSDHMVKGTCDFASGSGSASILVATGLSFILVDLMEIEINYFYLRDIMQLNCEWDYLTLSHHCARFDAYRSSGSEGFSFVM